MKKMIRTINYKTNEPTVYNKGTQWEKQCDEFLAYITNGSIEDAQAECEKLNAEKLSKLWNGRKVDWTKIAFFFASEQEDFVY